jgi:predicted regulator of Ras-like GTPase activity (Roadblock/LC7/MglB family)
VNHVDAEDLNCLVNDFTMHVADIAHAIVVSADGMPLAMSDGIPGQAVAQLAAITSGLTSLAAGAARIVDAAPALQALVEMDQGLMFVRAVSGGASLAVLAAPECDVRQVSFEMTRMVEAIGEILTPAARVQL